MISFHWLGRNVLLISGNVLWFSDVESPVFERCPSNQTHATEPGQATVVVAWNDLTAADNSNQEPNITCIPMSGTRFPIGQTNVTCTAHDGSGNMAKCNFVVAVKGYQLRVFTWFILFDVFTIKRVYVEDGNVNRYFKNSWSNQSDAVSNYSEMTVFHRFYVWDKNVK